MKYCSGVAVLSSLLVMRQPPETSRRQNKLPACFDSLALCRNLTILPHVSLFLPSERAVLLAYREREAMTIMKDLNRAGQPMPVRSTMKPTNTPHRKRILCYCQERAARNIEKGFPHAMYSFLTENICNFKQIIAYSKSFSKLQSFTSILFYFSQDRSSQYRLFSDLLLQIAYFIPLMVIFALFRIEKSSMFPKTYKL